MSSPVDSRLHSLRFLGYAGLFTGVIWLVSASATGRAGGLGLEAQVRALPLLTTTEFSLVEQLQHGVLLICCLIFAWIALSDRLRRPLAIWFSALFLLALIRELDFYFDTHGVDNLWQVISVLIAVPVSVYLVRHRRRAGAGWQQTWPTTGLTVMFVGFLLLVPFAQLLSRPGLWESTLGDAYVRVAVLAFEELAELAAYLVILIGSLELLFAWSQLARVRDQRRRSRRKPVTGRKPKRPTPAD